MKLRWKMIGLGVAILVIITSSNIRADNNVNIYTGEKKNVWLEITDRDGASFTIDSATYWIRYSDVSVMAQTSAVISGSRIYGLVNADNWIYDTEYGLYFRWHVTESPAESYITKVNLITYYGGVPTPTPSPTPSPSPTPA